MKDKMTTGELNILIDSLKEHVNEKFDGENGVNQRIDKLTVQVLKTNGRVSSLENWKNFIAGGLTVLTVLVVPMLFIVVDQWIRQK